MTTLYDIGHDCKTGSINYELGKAFTTGLVIGRYGEKLTTWMELDPKNRVEIHGDGVILIAATRESVIPAIQIFGGKWEKEPAMWEQAIIEYSQTIQDVHNFNLLIIIKGAPPPSCEIIEVDEFVPASTRKVKKIKCPTPTPDDAPGVVEPVAAPEPAPEAPAIAPVEDSPL